MRVFAGATAWLLHLHSLLYGVLLVAVTADNANVPRFVGTIPTTPEILRRGEGVAVLVAPHGDRIPSWRPPTAVLTEEQLIVPVVHTLSR